MNIALALILVIIAGILIGTYGTPPKYMVNWSDEIIWLVSSVASFFLFPILSIFVLSGSFSTPLQVINLIPANYFIVLMLCGITWGIGQILFSLSFRYIGIGLNFVINISIGTAGTALLPLLWNKNMLGTSYANLQILGIVIFILAVIICALAGGDRDRNRTLHAEKDNIQEDDHKRIKTGYLIIGVIFSVFAGIGSVCEGTSYVFANPTVSTIASQNSLPPISANLLAWVIVFVGAGIPFFIYFLVLVIKKGSIKNIFSKGNPKYFLLCAFMGLCYWLPIIMFSKSSMLIGGKLAPTIAWPLFMVFIILSSNVWSIVSGEWKGAGTSAVRKMTTGTVLFIGAIIVFTISSFIIMK